MDTFEDIKAVHSGTVIGQLSEGDRNFFARRKVYMHECARDRST
jgi:hypothetical protein